MTRGPLRIVLALLAALASGCAATERDTGGDREVDFPRAVYPPGPYGVEERARIADYALEGREGPVTLSAIRRDPSRTVLWIAVGAPWCPSCLSEAPTLAELAGVLEPEGLAVLAVVVTDLQGRRPDRADIDLVYPDLPTAVFDPWQAPSLTLDLAPDRTIALPQSLVVDLGSMRIVAHLAGWDEEEIRAELERRL